jgi:hypothetical protein
MGAGGHKAEKDGSELWQRPSAAAAAERPHPDDG